MLRIDGLQDAQYRPARRQVGKAGLHLAARPLLAQHNGTTLIVAYNVERVLADIDTDDGNGGLGGLGYGVLLVVGGPSQLRSLAGQEHGRTIPLGEIGYLPVA